MFDMRNENMKEKFLKGMQILREKGRALFQKCAGWFKKLLSAVKEKLGAALRYNQMTALIILKWWYLAAAVLFVVLVLYYPVGALIIHKIDVDPDFIGKDGGNVQAIDTMTALLRRETGTNTFTPNKPFFHPSAVLDDMPAFQEGIVSGVKNAAEAFQQINPNSESLKNAAERLAYPADVWHVSKWKPAVSSVKKYNKARTELEKYQKDVAEGKDAFDRSPDALAAVIERLEQEIENGAETLGEQISDASGKMVDTAADDVFFRVKGQTYVYFLVLRDLKKDFGAAFEREEFERDWINALELLRKAFGPKPFFVINGKIDAPTIPNHLVAAGFRLSRAAARLRNMLSDLRAEHE